MKSQINLIKICKEMQNKVKRNKTEKKQNKLKFNKINKN